MCVCGQRYTRPRRRIRCHAVREGTTTTQEQIIINNHHRRPDRFPEMKKEPAPVVDRMVRPGDGMYFMMEDTCTHSCSTPIRAAYAHTCKHRHALSLSTYLLRFATSSRDPSRSLPL